jgi:hypothetical protein
LVTEDGCLLALIALMIEAVRTSETTVNIYQTTLRNIPEDSHLHTRRCENLKSQSVTGWDGLDVVGKITFWPLPRIEPRPSRLSYDGKLSGRPLLIGSCLWLGNSVL